MLRIFFFFFKQKTAYEMLRSLVGSEMCIRDRPRDVRRRRTLRHVCSRRTHLIRQQTLYPLAACDCVEAGVGGDLVEPRAHRSAVELVEAAPRAQIALLHLSLIHI